MTEKVKGLASRPGRERHQTSAAEKKEEREEGRRRRVGKGWREELVVGLKT
jgi:hypothetical protein